MPAPDSMKLIEKDGNYSLNIDITRDEYETLSILGYPQLRGLWVPWQNSLDIMRNDPVNQDRLEEKRQELKDIVNRAQAKLGESIDNRENFRIMQQAFDEAGERGLTDEELKEACIRLQYPDTDPPESARSGWDNRHRSMRAKFADAQYIVFLQEMRPTHSSRARHLAQGIEPVGVAKVWRIRNLPITDEV